VTDQNRQPIPVNVLAIPVAECPAPLVTLGESQASSAADARHLSVAGLAMSGPATCNSEAAGIRAAETATTPQYGRANPV
jgi:hypothetical protein